MLHYRVIHHVPGRIRIEVPCIKKLSLSGLTQLSKIPLNPGIRGVRPGLIAGTLIVTYDPHAVDILSFLQQIASHPEVEAIFQEQASK